MQIQPAALCMNGSLCEGKSFGGSAWEEEGSEGRKLDRKPTGVESSGVGLGGADSELQDELESKAVDVAHYALASERQPSGCFSPGSFCSGPPFPPQRFWAKS